MKKEQKKLLLKYIKDTYKLNECNSLKSLAHHCFITKHKLSSFLFENDPSFYAEACSYLDIDVPDLPKVINDLEKLVSLKHVIASNSFVKFYEQVKESPDMHIEDVARKINASRKSVFNYQKALKDLWREHYVIQ